MVRVPTCVPDLVLALCMPGQCHPCLRMCVNSFMKAGDWRVMILSLVSVISFLRALERGVFMLSYLALTKVPGNHISGKSHSEICHIVGLVCHPCPSLCRWACWHPCVRTLPWLEACSVSSIPSTMSELLNLHRRI